MRRSLAVAVMFLALVSLCVWVAAEFLIPSRPQSRVLIFYSWALFSFQ